MYNRPVSVTGSDAAPVVLEMVAGRVVARVPLYPGVVSYGADMGAVLPTIGKALVAGTNVKEILKLHRTIEVRRTAIGTAPHFLMVRSHALCLGTMFGRVCDDLLPTGLRCANSNIIEPVRKMNRDDRTFVFVGESTEPLTHIPVELFTVECFREHVPLSLRKRMPRCAEDPATLTAAFATCPDDGRPACIFVTKGGMLDKLHREDWVVADPTKLVGHERLSDPEARLAQVQVFPCSKSPCSHHSVRCCFVA